MFKYHHTAISVTDINRSVDFYSKLGFRKVLEWSSDSKDLTIVHLLLDSFFLELFCYHHHTATTVLHDLTHDLRQIGVRHFALQVDSIIDAKTFIENNKIATDIEIKEGRTGVKYFFITDPDRIFIELVQDDRKFK